MSIQFSEEKRQEWKEKILRQRESGLSINRWCIENNIAPHIFYYWKSKIFPKNHLDHSSFKELKDEKETGIIIEFQGLSIHLERQFDSYTLKRCLDILKEIKC